MTRLTASMHQGSPFSPWNIHKGITVYQAALEHAQQTHARRCKVDSSPMDDRLANGSAGRCQRALDLAKRLP